MSHWFQTISKSSQANPIRFQVLGTVGPPSGLEALQSELVVLPYCLVTPPHESSFLFYKMIAYVCFWVVLSTCFLPGEFWGSESSLLFCPFNPSWQCLPWYNILKNLVGFLYMSWRFTPVDKDLLHKPFLENLLSIFWLLSSCLRVSMKHTPYLFREHLCYWMFWYFYLLEVLAKDCITTLDFFL